MFWHTKPSDPSAAPLHPTDFFAGQPFECDPVIRRPPWVFDTPRGFEPLRHPMDIPQLSRAQFPLPPVSRSTANRGTVRALTVSSRCSGASR